MIPQALLPPSKFRIWVVSGSFFEQDAKCKNCHLWGSQFRALWETTTCEWLHEPPTMYTRSYSHTNQFNANNILGYLSDPRVAGSFLARKKHSTFPLVRSTHRNSLSNKLFDIFGNRRDQMSAFFISHCIFSILCSLITFDCLISLSILFYRNRNRSLHLRRHEMNWNFFNKEENTT